MLRGPAQGGTVTVTVTVLGGESGQRGEAVSEATRCEVPTGLEPGPKAPAAGISHVALLSVAGDLARIQRGHKLVPRQERDRPPGETQTGTLEDTLGGVCQGCRPPKEAWELGRGGWGRRYLYIVALKPGTVTLSGERIFAEVTKSRNSSHSGQSRNSMTSVLIRGTRTHGHRGEAL